MQALMMTKYGNISTSLAFQSIATPKASPSQVIIKVHASSINPFDYKVLKGEFKAFKKINFPQGIGRDVSGVVVEVGDLVSNLKVGDAVLSRIDEELVGTMAEYVASEAQHTALKPQEMTHEEAASMPLAGLTALQALVTTVQLKAGEKVLIHAGSGGVGTIAIQLAKSLGAFVATTTSTANVDLVKKLGADQVIDYKKEDYLEQVSDFDVVFDTLGGVYTLDAFKVIKNGGRVVSVNGEVDDILAKKLGLNFIIRKILSLKARKITQAAVKKNATYRMILMNSDGVQLAELANLYLQEKIKAVIDRSYPFTESIDAFEYLSKGRAKGKVVITH
jgi:alcohol dehydrogenase|tara:strand:- start:627 stop:1628 length:1002 start_codon:yes stop_codon:yes gene_type:complete